jgi:hypothetical protein
LPGIAFWDARSESFYWNENKNLTLSILAGFGNLGLIKMVFPFYF